LEQKTQVFDPNYCDHFRNRLTHTLEVSQIARTVGQALGINTDLCEVLALSHDIGHPPFSHEGEKALDRVMHRYGSGFDHNLHALRIVESFEEKYAAFPGLNLTFEVREGIVKHSRDYEPDEKAYLDISEYRLGERPPLEAQLIDLADEIAYNSADLDDGYESGLLTLPQVLDHVEIAARLFSEVDQLYPDAPEKLKVSEMVRRLIDNLASSLIRNGRERLRALEIVSVEQVRAWPTRLLQFEDEMARHSGSLKQFLRSHLYDHPALKSAREDVQRLIEQIFDFYMADPAALPEGQLGKTRHLPLEVVVCDYIAGMTDQYARARFALLCGR
jgi:dGTPase